MSKIQAKDYIYWGILIVCAIIGVIGYRGIAKDNRKLTQNNKILTQKMEQINTSAQTAYQYFTTNNFNAPVVIQAIESIRKASEDVATIGR